MLICDPCAGPHPIPRDAQRCPVKRSDQVNYNITTPNDRSVIDVVAKAPPPSAAASVRSDRCDHARGCCRACMHAPRVLALTATLAAYITAITPPRRRTICKKIVAADKRNYSSTADVGVIWSRPRCSSYYTRVVVGNDDQLVKFRRTRRWRSALRQRTRIGILGCVSPNHITVFTFIFRAEEIRSKCKHAQVLI